MKNKKLQVFVSSTYLDLHDERQAAVSAILKAGHIPAGMELFTAGDESQWDAITRWIEESDIYMLILGGRYGSMSSETGLSYTEMEYDYAVKLGKPFFRLLFMMMLLRCVLRSGGVPLWRGKIRGGLRISGKRYWGRYRLSIGMIKILS